MLWATNRMYKNDAGRRWCDEENVYYSLEKFNLAFKFTPTRLTLLPHAATAGVNKNRCYWRSRRCVN